jgi:hypothetical protein
MLRSGVSVSAITAVILGCALAHPVAAAAQRHDGGGSSTGGGINGSVSGSNRPTGIDEKDAALKDFQQTLAEQATSLQIAEFQALVKSTLAAQSELQSLLQQLRGASATPDSARRSTLDPALEDARNRNKKFQEGFSEPQKSGLKDIAKRLAKADSDLEQEEKKLDQSLDLKSPSPDLVAHAESLDKALTDFFNQQLALGREMSITLANAQDVAFTLSQVKTVVRIGRQTIPIAVSGVLSQIAAQGGQRTFQLELVADLSPLQQNITDVMRAQLETSATCGERLAIRQATLTPSAPATVLTLWLHYERWLCTGGPRTATELAEGDGKAEFKLTTTLGQPNTGQPNTGQPTLDAPNTLKVTAVFGRIDATGMFAEALRSGSLGDDLRDQVAQSVLSAVRAASDFKVALPPAIQNSAVLQTAKFQNWGAGGLSVVVEGRIELSNEQTTQLAAQLNQALSAQGTPAQGTTP